MDELQEHSVEVDMKTLIHVISSDLNRPSNFILSKLLKLILHFSLDIHFLKCARSVRNSKNSFVLPLWRVKLAVLPSMHWRNCLTGILPPKS